MEAERDCRVAADQLEKELERLAAVRGTSLSWLPESGFVTVTGMPGASDAHVTLLRNVGRSNVSHLFSGKKVLLPEENTLTVAKGFVGAYPNSFLRVDRGALPAFVAAIGKLESEADYGALLDRYGVRRSNPAFWAHSDDVFAAYERLSPLEAGRFDYGRLENR